MHAYSKRTGNKYRTTRANTRQVARPITKAEIAREGVPSEMIDALLELRGEYGAGARFSVAHRHPGAFEWMLTQQSAPLQIARFLTGAIVSYQNSDLRDACRVLISVTVFETEECVL